MRQALFEGALARERQRADRSDEPLALLIVTAADPAGVDSRIWDAVVDGVAAAKREADLLGWLRPQAALGVVLTEVPAVEHALGGLLDRRIRRQLRRRLDGDIADQFSIRLHVYPEPTPAGTAALPSAEPLLEDIRSRSVPRSGYDAVKRGLDVLGSLALLAVLSPLMAAIAALIKLSSPGPVFFRQLRVGQQANPFTMLKFRTMNVSADHEIHKAFTTDFIKATNQPGESQANKLFKIARDPRVTRFGSLLRKTSLDELPQLWNVARGEMSLVGPRPPIPYEVDQYKPWHRRRVLESKPGITGLWQVVGRSRTSFDEMVRLDLRYARTRSLSTDLKILLATPAAVIAGKGAC
jgi:lipopolysaccharide/colanic/teichoic acid biosynthesis glycosyltransferase